MPRSLSFSLQIVCLLPCLMLSIAWQTQKPPLNKPTPAIQTLLEQAKSLRRADKTAEAESLYPKILEQARATQDKAGEAAALADYANFLARTNKMEQALKLAEQARTLAHNLPNSLIEAAGWEGSGMAYFYLGRPQQAIEPFKNARALYHEGGDQTYEARSAMALGVMYENTGNLKDAVELYEQVLPIFRDIKDKLGEANTLTNLAIAHQKLGANAKSIEDAKQALPLYRELKEKGNEANVLNILAVNTLILQDLPKALEWSETAVAAAREANSSRIESEAIGTLGDVYREMGQNRKALEYYTQALPLDRVARRPRNEAATLNNMGIVYSRMGEASKAMEFYQQASTIYEQMGNKAELTSIQINMGYLCGQLQRHQQAKFYFLAALATAKQTNDRDALARIANGLGESECSQDNYSAAIQHYREALTFYQKTGRRAEQAAILGNIGTAYLVSGKNSEALGWFQQAMRLFKQIGDKNGIANTAFSLGEISYNLKKPARETDAYFHTAVQTSEAAGNRLYEARGFKGLAIAAKSRGELAQAENHSTQAVALLETIRTSFGGSGAGKSEFLAGMLDVYENHLDILMMRRKFAEAFAFAQKTKARTLLDTLAYGRVDLSSVLTDAERQQEQTLRDRADSLNQQMVKEGVQNEVGAKKRFAALKAELKTAEGEIQAFTETLYAHHPELVRRRVAETVTLADLAAVIPADTALLDYVILPQKGINLFIVTTQQGKPKVNAVQIPFAMETLRKQTAVFRLACSDPRKEWQSQSKALYARLIAPAEKSLRGKTRLILCPDGALWDVPFAALSDGARPLWTRYELAYAYSATGARAAYLLAQERKREKAAQSLLICANPDFGTAKRFGDLDDLPGQRPISEPSRPISDPSRPLTDPARTISIQAAATVPTRGGAIAPLVGTQREADALKALFPSAEVLTGKNAQESAVKAKMGSYRYLHFATHGFLNDASPMLSSVVLAAPEAGSKEDGFLTAREVYSLTLHAEMTTLSACNTGRGTTQRGEGMVGLTWALLCAGCPTQVVSMWSVDDAATAQLMTAFYKNLKAGQGKAAALRTAAQSLRQQASHRHPYYWAAFVVMGEGR